MLEIRLIDPEMTYSLRHSILRPNQSIDDCKFDTDYSENAFHIGAFHEGMLITVASFCIENHPDFPAEQQYRLRAMATMEDFRRLGAGRLVVDYAEKLIREKGVEFLWCKGRTSVQEYYQKLGFVPHGEVFDYPPIGPHIIMYKSLD